MNNFNKDMIFIRRHTMSTQLLSPEIKIRAIQDLWGYNWISTTHGVLHGIQPES